MSWKTYEVVGSSYGMRNPQPSIFWEPLKELQNEIEEDMELLPEFRIYRIDEV